MSIQAFVSHWRCNMNPQQLNKIVFLSFLVLPFFLIGCSQGTSLETLAKKPAKKAQGSTSNSQITNTELDNSEETAPTKTASSTQDSAACVSTRNKVSAINQTCGDTIRDAEDVLSPSCFSAFQNIQDTSCQGIDSRFNLFKTTCYSMLAQYRSYLPSSCVNAISAAL